MSNKVYLAPFLSRVSQAILKERFMIMLQEGMVGGIIRNLLYAWPRLKSSLDSPRLLELELVSRY